ncbi:hypothetical protein B0T16DRAFT_144484 [Cercophora newfieldiana]|uniref:Uncharacterized protein n=1 Tax=Cercophora newfieldiana TaxID=92897 RepID=A0AA39Y437_9PEZI|nr:hypothetical protein B0T16DRAFT_144484 [Cercophora newfieldiana]
MCVLTNAGEPYKTEGQGVQTLEGGRGLDANPGWGDARRFGRRVSFACSVMRSQQAASARSPALCLLSSAVLPKEGRVAGWHAELRTFAAGRDEVVGRRTGVEAEETTPRPGKQDPRDLPYYRFRRLYYSSRGAGVVGMISLKVKGTGRQVGVLSGSDGSWPQGGGTRETQNAGESYRGWQPVCAVWLGAAPKKQARRGEEDKVTQSPGAGDGSGAKRGVCKVNWELLILSGVLLFGRRGRGGQKRGEVLARRAKCHEGQNCKLAREREGREWPWVAE